MLAGGKQPRGATAALLHGRKITSGRTWSCHALEFTIIRFRLSLYYARFSRSTRDDIDESCAVLKTGCEVPFQLLGCRELNGIPVSKTPSSSQERIGDHHA